VSRVRDRHFVVKPLAAQRGQYVCDVSEPLLLTSIVCLASSDRFEPAVGDNLAVAVAVDANRTGAVHRGVWNEGVRTASRVMTLTAMIGRISSRSVMTIGMARRGLSRMSEILDTIAVMSRSIGFQFAMSNFDNVTS